MSTAGPPRRLIPAPAFRTTLQGLALRLAAESPRLFHGHPRDEFLRVRANDVRFTSADASYSYSQVRHTACSRPVRRRGSRTPMHEQRIDVEASTITTSVAPFHDTPTHPHPHPHMHDAPYQHNHPHGPPRQLNLFGEEGDPNDPWRRLPALAARLGVEPLVLEPNAQPKGTVAINTKDGRYYDLFDLIGALLDRVERL